MDIETLRQEYADACFNGDIYLVTKMITCEDKKFKTEYFLSWCIKKACKGGQYKIFKILHEYKDIRTFYNEGHDETLSLFFHYACKGGNIKIIDKIMRIFERQCKNKNKKGTFDKYQRHDFYIDGVYGACVGGYVEIYKLCTGRLVDNTYLTVYTDVSELNYPKLLNKACLSDCVDMVNYVIECGNKYTAKWEWNDALIKACEAGSVDVAKFLVTCGATDFKNGFMASCMHYQPETIKLMVSYGVNIIKHCIYNVCEMGDLKIILLLLKNGFIGFYDLEDGMNGSCKGGHMKLVELFMKLGLSDWNSYMEHACRGGNMDIVKLMFSKGANNQDECVSIACIEGHMDIAKFMVEKSPDYFGSDECLFQACRHGDLSFAKLLVEKGVRNLDECLESSCEAGNYSTAKLMIECGATNLNECLESVNYENVDLINLLVSAGATNLQCLEYTNDLKLYCSYCKYMGIKPSDDTEVYHELLNYEPGCVLFSGSRLVLNRNRNGGNGIARQVCHVARLPIEIYKMLIMY